MILFRLFICALGSLLFQNANAASRSYLYYNGPEFYLNAVLEENSARTGWDVHHFEFNYKNPTSAHTSVNPLHKLSALTVYQTTLRYLGPKKFSLTSKSLDRIKNLIAVSYMRGFTDYTGQNDAVALKIRDDQRPENCEIGIIHLFPMTGEIAFEPTRTTNPLQEFWRGKYIEKQIFNGDILLAQVSHYDLKTQEQLNRRILENKTLIEGVSKDLKFRVTLENAYSKEIQLKDISVRSQGLLDWSQEVQIYREDLPDHMRQVNNTSSLVKVSLDENGFPALTSTSSSGREFKLSFDKYGRANATFGGNPISQIHIVTGLRQLP